MKIKILSLFVVLSLIFLSCSVNVSKISIGALKDFENKVSYTKDDRTGFCFAVIASRATGKTDSTGLGVSKVPCTDKVKSLLYK